MVGSGDLLDVIIRLGALAGALAAIGFVLAYLYRRTGLIKVWKWLTRHIREDRAAERTEELRKALEHPAVKSMRADEIKSAIKTEVVPRFDQLSRRLTEHMDEERDAIFEIHKEVKEIRETVTTHMEADESQFAAAHEALATGQDRLIDALGEISGRIGNIEDQLPPSRRKP